MDITQSKRTKFIKILRWIAFLPVGGALIALAQAVAVTVAETYGWQRSAVWIVIFGGVFVGAGIIPTMFAPDRKVGASVLLTLFVLLEGSALASTVSEMELYPFIVRLYVDVTVTVGVIAAAIQKNLGGEQPT